MTPQWRTVSVKAQFVRKSVPGSGPGDQLKASGKGDGEWLDVVDFKESDKGLITFTLAGGATRRLSADSLVAVRRLSKD